MPFALAALWSGACAGKFTGEAKKLCMPRQIFLGFVFLILELSPGAENWIYLNPLGFKLSPDASVNTCISASARIVSYSCIQHIATHALICLFFFLSLWAHPAPSPEHIKDQIPA